jgi:PAS domain S-box-containing protein
MANPQKQVNLRPSGIDIIGSVPWGTHFCQFYSSTQDLLDTLIPYFKAGLENNEFCMWVTSEPLQASEAAEQLRLAFPQANDYICSGQIEILDYREWYIRNGQFNSNEVLQGWLKKLAAARARGYDGLRLSGNTFWLEASLWDDFTQYEEKVNESLGNDRIIALCTYSSEKCSLPEILDVVANHQFALIKSKGEWEVIESSTRASMERSLRESEDRYHSLFTQMNEGFALHEIILDPQGNPVDYRFLDVNPAFEVFTGLSRVDVLGQTVREIIPGIEQLWIKIYGEVALTGKAAQFQNYSEPLGKYYDVMAFSPRLGQFATIFIDVTEQKRMQAEAQEAAAKIELQHRLIEQREQERLEIARELHDGPIQELTAAAYTLQAIISECNDEAQANELAQLQRTLTAQINAIREFSQELRPPVLTHYGLEKAIHAHLESSQQKYTQFHINFDPGHISDLVHIPDHIQLAVYRIFREAYNNIVRHSQATQVDIAMQIVSDSLILTVQDDGIGFEPEKDWTSLMQQGHLGLVGMRERAESMNGTIKVQSKPGSGTTLTLSVPLPPAERKS